MNDVLRQLMLTAGDPHLVALEAVARPKRIVGKVRAIGHSLGSHIRQAGARLRLAQAHGAREAPGEFILGKHLGLSAVLAILVAGMTAIYLSILSFAQVSYELTPLLLTAFFLFLELSLVTAAALLFSVFTSSILAILLTSSLYLVGHLSEGMVKLAGVTKNPSFQQLTDNLYLVLPDLSRLDLKNSAVYGVIPQADTLLINAGYAVIYTAILLILTTTIFSRRQF